MTCQLQLRTRNSSRSFSSVMFAPLGDGCCEKPIVRRERAGTPFTPAALHLQGAGFFVRGLFAVHASKSPFFAQKTLYERFRKVRKAS